MRDEPEALPRFRIRLLGSLAVERDGEPLPAREVGSRKGRTLLKLLLVERGHALSSDRIAGALWGDDVPAKADGNLASLVSRLRALLGADAIAGGRDGYRFVPGERFDLDLDDAVRLTAESDARLVAGEPAFAAAAAGQALAMLDAGELLQDEPSAPWLDDARTAVERLRRRARGAAWRAAIALGSPTDAAVLAEAAAAADPLDEEAHRALMTAYRDAGELAKALAAFERLRETLAEELGADPSVETRDLHLSLLRDAPAAAGEDDAPHDDGPPTGPRDPGFLGRDVELAELRTQWASATSGRPALVVIRGEAGIGKTRLASEVAGLARDTGGLVVSVRCFEAERSLLLQPWAEAIRAVIVGTNPETVRLAASDDAATLADLVPEVDRILRPRPRERGSPELERRRTFEAVAAFFRALARNRPLLILFDDLHNAGSSTLELLHFAFRRLPPGRILVLATVRSDEGEEASEALSDVATMMDLGPLADEDVSAIANAMGSPLQAERIRALTGGHPLFVVEALRALAEGPGDDRPVPESLRAAVLARVRRLGPEVEDLLRAAATFGSVFDPMLLSRLIELPIEEITARADRALRARLLVEADALYGFANDLIREVIYQTTPMPARVSRHRRAAELVADRPEAAAEHALASGDLAAAARGFLAAGELAARRYANRDASDLLDRAMDAVIVTDDRALEAGVRLARGRVRESLRDLDGAFEDFSEANRLASENGQAQVELAANRELGGDIMVSRGRPTRDCIPYLETALNIAERIGDRRAEIWVRARLAILYSNLGQLDLCRAQAEHAVALAREVGDDRSIAWALDAMKTSAAYLGDLDTLRRDLPELDTVLRRLGDQWLLQWTVFESSFLPMAAGHWDRAIERIDDALAIGRRIGDVPGRPMFLAHRCWVLRSRGDYAGALADGHAAVQSAVDVAHRWWNALGGTMLAWTYQDLGADDHAITELELALEAAERTDSAFYTVRCLAHLAWARWCVGDHADGGELADRATAVSAQITTPPGIAFLHGAHASFQIARVRQAQGRAKETEPMLRGILRGADRVGWREVAADAGILLGRARAAAGDPARARRLLARGLQVAEGAGLPRAAWEAHAALALLERSNGGAHGSATHRAAARAIGAELAGRLEEPALRDSLVAAVDAALSPR